MHILKYRMNVCKHPSIPWGANDLVGIPKPKKITCLPLSSPEAQCAGLSTNSLN